MSTTNFAEIVKLSQNGKVVSRASGDNSKLISALDAMVGRLDRLFTLLESSHSPMMAVPPAPPPAPLVDVTYTVVEAAAYVGCTPQNVHLAIKRGKLASVSGNGANTMFSRSSIDKWRSGVDPRYWHNKHKQAGVPSPTITQVKPVKPKAEPKPRPVSRSMAAKILSMDRFAFDTLFINKEIPFQFSGKNKRVIIRREDLDAYIKTNVKAETKPRHVPGAEFRD